MCIAILTTTHPAYRYVIINNRDEFLSRPTAPATWWSPSPFSSSTPDKPPPTHILSARDLARPAHGTWLGVTREGRVAVLTNCLEKECAQAVGVRSRGGIIRGWLTSTSTNSSSTATTGEEGEGRGSSVVEGFIEELKRDGDLGSVGGFNLLFGDLSQGQVDDGLVIISNRSTASECCTTTGDSVVIRKIGEGAKTGETIALSNMTLSEEFNEGQKWRKITLGEDLTTKAVHDSLRAHESEGALIERLFDVLSTDTLPRLPGNEKAEAYLGVFRESIFIPAIGMRGHREQHGEVTGNERLLDPSYMQGLYGTQTQTVILIGYDGRVRFVARTLYDEDGRPLSGEERERSFEFVVGR
ncbi:NRDE protein-domain-containing protein [Aspergillus spectabilis]